MRDKGGRGGQKVGKLRDAIYERSLTQKLHKMLHLLLIYEKKVSEPEFMCHGNWWQTGEVLKRLCNKKRPRHKWPLFTLIYGTQGECR